MKQITFIKKPAALLFLLIFPVIMNGQSDFQQQKDSLRKLIPTLEGTDKLRAHSDLTHLYFESTINEQMLDTLLAYYREYDKEARKQGNMKAQGAIRRSKLSAYFKVGKYDDIINLAYDDLLFLSRHKLWESYFLAHRVLLDSYIYKQQYGKALIETKMCYKMAKGEKNSGEDMSPAIFALAEMYKTLNRHAEAEKYFREYIESQAGAKEINNNLIYSYQGLCEVLLEQQKYDDATALMRPWEEITIRYCENRPHPSAWYIYYSTYAYLYARIKQFDKAEYYCNLAEQQLSNKAAMSTLLIIRTLIAESRNEYSKALAYCEEAYRLNIEVGNIPFSTDAQVIKARLLTKLGDCTDVYAIMEHVGEQRDSLMKLEFHAQMDEIRTQYEVDELTAQKEAQRNYTLMAIGGCVLLLIALIIYIVYSRRLKAKNRSLYQQIQERLQREKAAEEVLEQVPDEKLSRELLLFRQLQERMHTERLFAEPDLNRKKLADLLGTNEMYLADAIKEGSGATFSEYISQLRLHYSLELLGSHPELTLEAVAVDSGHNSYSPFFRAFTKMYGMSPSEYRKLSGAK